MQWNNSINAGFTTGKPWFHVNPNYTEINVKQQLNDKFSILSYYKALIQLKKSDLIYIYGKFNMVDAENKQVFAYTRTFKNNTVLIVANLTNEVSELNLPFELDISSVDIKLHNYHLNDINLDHIKPYESFVVEI